MLEAVGYNAGLLTAVLPEFASLLRVMPDPGDPLTAQARAQRAAADALRAVAAPQRPLVLVMDDLQWAGRTPLGFVDLVLSDRPIEGLLFVGAYREEAVDAAHPLAAPLVALERAGHASGSCGSRTFPCTALAALVAEILRVDVATAARLAEVIEPHTSGNPYETIELLNALRRDGLLAVTAKAGAGTRRPSAHTSGARRSARCSGRAWPRCRRRPVGWSSRWRAWAGESGCACSRTRPACRRPPSRLRSSLRSKKVCC